MVSSLIVHVAKRFGPCLALIDFAVEQQSGVLAGCHLCFSNDNVRGFSDMCWFFSKKSFVKTIQVFKNESHLVAGFPAACCAKRGCCITAGLLPVLEWFGVIAVAVCWRVETQLITRYHIERKLTFLSANFNGNICATPDGEVIVFTFTLVDGFVLEKNLSRKNLSC